MAPTGVVLSSHRRMIIPAVRVRVVDGVGTGGWGGGCVPAATLLGAEDPLLTTCAAPARRPPLPTGTHIPAQTSARRPPHSSRSTMCPHWGHTRQTQRSPRRRTSGWRGRPSTRQRLTLRMPGCRGHTREEASEGNATIAQVRVGPYSSPKTCTLRAPHPSPHSHPQTHIAAVPLTGTQHAACPPLPHSRYTATPASHTFARCNTHSLGPQERALGAMGTLLYPVSYAGFARRVARLALGQQVHKPCTRGGHE
jgi:hypothetical protein